MSEGASSTVRTVEAVATLSLAIDIGMGQPLEQGLRTCLVATGLARAFGLIEDDVRRVFYLALLRHVGCTAESDLAASFLGDEIAFRGGAMTLDFSKPSAMFPYVLRHAGQGKSAFSRAGHVVRLVAGSKRFMASAEAVCEAGQILAGRLGLDAEISQALWQVFERWDGRGIPGRVGGEEIAVPARFVSIAETFEVFARLEGPDKALDVVRSRRGRAYNPEIADCLCREARALLARLDQASMWDDVLEAEPERRSALSEDGLEAVLEAMADFADLKSTFLLGHSRGVAALAESAGVVCGLPAAAVTALRRAGLVHDVGRVGISSTVWGKPGPLTRDEWEKVRLHPYYTERVLTRPAVLAELGRLASMHHERLDGAGYHRGVSGAGLPRPARILAAADGYRARAEPRPHREAMTPEQAAASLRADVRDGRLDADAVDAVLHAAGAGRTRRRRRAQVAGLTEREIEVLGLVARGRSIREIADALTISPKTADAHIQHIYTKVGVATRAGATLFALEYGLVDRTEDHQR